MGSPWGRPVSSDSVGVFAVLIVILLIGCFWFIYIIEGLGGYLGVWGPEGVRE